MADPSELSKRERQIMDVVYAHGEATIAQLHAELPDPPMRGASDSRLGQGGAKSARDGGRLPGRERHAR